MLVSCSMYGYFIINAFNFRAVPSAHRLVVAGTFATAILPYSTGSLADGRILHHFAEDWL